MRYRPRRPLKDRVIAEWRGYWEPQDVSKYEDTIDTVVGKTMKGLGLSDRFNEEMVFEAWNEMVDPFIAANARPLTLEEITALQAGKTGALIRFSAEAGAILAGADPAPLRRYATALGLAFQIWDDVLDVTGDAALTGKAVGKDAAAGKATFVSLLGLEPAKARAKSLIDEAEAALSVYGPAAQNLIDCARFVISREN